MIAASATSNAPWITYAVLNPLSPMMDGRTQRAGPYR